MESIAQHHHQAALSTEPFFAAWKYFAYRFMVGGIRALRNSTFCIHQFALLKKFSSIGKSGNAATRSE